MSAFLKALALIPQLLPVISAFVQQVETLLGGASGSSKLAAVLASVEAYISKIEADANVIAELKTMLTPLVDAAVAMFNQSGLFSHAKASAPAPSEPAPSAPAA